MVVEKKFFPLNFEVQLGIRLPGQGTIHSPGTALRRVSGLALAMGQT
jgi:hypothetical protein